MASTSYISDQAAITILRVLDYAYPAILLFFFLTAFTARSILLSTPAEPKPAGSPPLGPTGKPLPPTKAKTSDKKKIVPLDFSRPRKLLFMYLAILVTVTFVGNGANVIVHALAEREQRWWCGPAYVFYVVGSFFVYSLFVMNIIEAVPSPTTANLATWILGIVMELVLLGASLSLYTHPHREPTIRPESHNGGHKGKVQYHMTSWEAMEISIDLARIFLLAAQVGFYLIFVVSRNAQARKDKAKKTDGTKDETTSLLGEPHVQEPADQQDERDLEADQARMEAMEAQAGDRTSYDAQNAISQERNAKLIKDDDPIPDEQDSPEAQNQGPNPSRNSKADHDDLEAEGDQQPLLVHGTSHAPEVNGSAHKNYGTLKKKKSKTDGAPTTTQAPTSPQQEDIAGWERPDKVPPRDWWEYLRGYTFLLPYLWPSGDRKLQINVLLCIMIMVVQRFINILSPTQIGYITDQLAGKDGQPVHAPWGAICLYLFYRLLQGGNGILGAARAMLWIPVSQYSYRAITTASFEHVHGLSLDFHLGKKTGEVVSALGKGSSINNFLENVTFQVLPMIVDLVIAIAYFLIEFDSYYALIISIVTFWYIYITIRMAQWRADVRRDMVNNDRLQDAVKSDSMMSYETVKYFNAEPFEFQRYRDAVNKYLYSEYLVYWTLNIMNVAQNTVFVLGLLASSFLVAYQISDGQRDVGKFTTLVFYMTQLQQPLNFFGTFYRMIQNNMLSAERMLELFKVKPTVTDHWDARTMPSCEGRINFNDVKFAYDPRRAALDGVSFDIRPGRTCALVGESGGGKSTVFRLLFRFYNQESGSIQVDGKDVQEITIDSLRQQIGVVPQDTILFNETIMYNLRYANQQVTDEEIHAACRAAAIHERILAFPDGYNTKVGERGLRLSGGEKQRVAIARCILKNPRIILLDEATAALDSDTEQHIQEALTALGHGRTMLVIAHRLSTITTADQIIVLHKGKVAETGTHEELIERQGRYAGMWEKQIKVQKAAEEAKKARDRAEQLRLEMQENSASQSEDEAGGHASHDFKQRDFAGEMSKLGGADEKPPGHP